MQEDLRLTLFARRCYSREFPLDAGFCKNVRSWDCPSSLARVSHHNQRLTPAVRQAGPHLTRTSARFQQRGMTLSDHTTAHNSESNSAVATETEPTASEPTLTEQPMSEQKTAETNLTEQHPTEPNQAAAPAAQASEDAPRTTSDDKHAGEDFASALESFTRRPKRRWEKTA